MSYGSQNKFSWLGICSTLFICLCSVLQTDDALACQPDGPSCRSPVRLFGKDAEVPGNLIYFKVLVDEPGELTLRTADGSPIPASIRDMGSDRVFAPDEAVAADQQLELEYTTVCPAVDTLEPSQEVYSFTTFKTEQIELRQPELAVEEMGIAYPGSENNEAVFYRLRYYSPDVNTFAYHLIDNHVTVDGEPYDIQTIDNIPMIELRTNCMPTNTENLMDSCGRIYSYTAGKHQVIAWSTVVGETDEPQRAQMDIDLVCDEPLYPTPSSSSSADAGCSVTHVSSQSSLSHLIIFLIGLSAYTLCRRRRF